VRHANSRCTLDVYGQARVTAKREAQQRIVQMILTDEGLTSEISFNEEVQMSVWAAPQNETKVTILGF
jgi:hypothetical protein